MTSPETISDSQIKMIEIPFHGVNPVRQDLSRFYTNTWVNERGVAVRAIKSTVSDIHFPDHDNHPGQVELRNERTNGYTIEFAQKVGHLVLAERVSIFLADRYDPTICAVGSLSQETSYLDLSKHATPSCFQEQFTLLGDITKGQYPIAIDDMPDCKGHGIPQIIRHEKDESDPERFNLVLDAQKLAETLAW
ncbi:hypothetical protein HGB25_02340 [Candidatus Saccharibacteria bacterium]|nr:hypothetical protein [Candidatus Saccharibacteria bacterium]